MTASDAAEMFDPCEHIVARLNHTVDELVALNEKTNDSDASDTLSNAIKFLNMHKVQFAAFQEWLSDGSADKAAAKLHEKQVRLGELVDADDPDELESVLDHAIPVVETLCEIVTEQESEQSGQ